MKTLLMVAQMAFTVIIVFLSPSNHMIYMGSALIFLVNLLTIKYNHKFLFFLQFLLFWIYGYFAIGEISQYQNFYTYDEYFNYTKFNTPKTINEIMIFSYFIYYPLVPLSILVTKKENALALGLMCLLGYISYLTIPVHGPKFLFKSDDFYFLYPLYEYIISTRNNFIDAFPSCHTALSLISAIYLNKTKFKAIGWISLFLIILSTYFLAFHYWQDLLFGILLALIAIKIANTSDDESAS